MLIVTTDEIPGKKLEPLGLVKGETVESKHVGKDIMAGFKGLVGGELKGYTEMISDARRLATERMVQEALSLGADAIVATRFSSSSIMQGASEILVYGTAVKFV
ncbi:MAG: heavy metal-binding domain-containing protein [Clostridiales bacterium]|jgi:uncharacterized protein YbjQ (UPF0145 family)|nr:heavy metal-binding domain-containing protein [Clostridiales bacterium]